MAAVKYSPFANRQFLNANGAPASGWHLWSYAAGSSSLVPTYTDSSGTVANSNPIVLDSLGFPPNQVWQTSGIEVQYVLADESGVDKRTEDNVPGVNDSTVSTNQWVGSGVAPTYLSASTFSVPGDQTTEFHIGRRLQLTTTAGTVYGVITASVYGTVTTVTVSLDSGVLDSGLSAVNLSILRADHLAIPYASAGRLIGIQKFTASGTYTPTPGTTSVVVEVQGGGGGGGGSSATAAGQLSGGNGGNSGAYGKSRITSGFSGVTVTVGTGGNGGGAGATGSAGAASSFGALVSAPGGAGGSSAGPVAPPFMGAASINSAVATGANISNQTSHAGFPALLINTASAQAGTGGSSMFGGGPAGSPGVGAGTNAVNYGTGGSGALTGASGSAFSGGNGAAGVVIVWEFAS